MRYERGFESGTGVGRTQVSGQRVKTELEVVGEGADQRGVAGSVAAGDAGDGDGEVALEAAGGRLAVDVEAVADLRLFQVAEEGVDAAEVVGVVGPEADVAIEAG